MRKVNWCSAVLTTILILSAGGCSTQRPAAPSGKLSVEREFAVAPREMVNVIKRAVPVESESKGNIVTGWQDFPGEWHVARRWRERTRFYVTVIPDWDEPAAKSRVSVTTETQTRATSGQEWEPAGELDRRARAEDLLRRIETAAVNPK
jgi:hypothetical protein